jgi:hypothetical protein
MSHPTDRQTFRAVVADVAAKAKAKLPEAVNGRIESAAKLVLWQDVAPQADGSILVGSTTDPGKQYRLVGLTCECQDFTRGQAPDGWCQHRIAAGMQKRVRELLPPEPQPEGVSSAYTLPEAPASCNVYVTISGHKVQVTLRDSDEQRMLARLAVLLEQYPAPQPAPQASSQGQNEALIKDWCSTHQVRMHQTTKNGQSWWSHKTPEGWCKGH